MAAHPTLVTAETFAQDSPVSSAPVRHPNTSLTRLGVSSRLHPVVLAGLGVAAITALLALLTWHAWGDLNSDTGYDVIAASKVAGGAVPYRDFVYYYGPLAPAIGGMASLVGGAGFGPLVAVGFALTAAILATTFILGRALAGAAGAFLAT